MAGVHPSKRHRPRAMSKSESSSASTESTRAIRDFHPNHHVLGLYKCSCTRRLLFFHLNTKPNVFNSSSGSWNPKVRCPSVDGACRSSCIYLFYIGELAIFFSSSPCLSLGPRCPKSLERWTSVNFRQSRQWRHRAVVFSGDSTAGLPLGLVTSVQIRINGLD
jgi:hypothetical protein